MKKVLVIYIRCIKDILSLSAQEQYPSEQRPIEFVEDLSISHDDINDQCIRLFSLLSSSTGQIKADKSIFDHVIFLGQSLFDQLFTLQVKELIHATRCEDLMLRIDGSLVQVPWELLHEGRHFLCQRFSIGRMVSTRQQGIHPAVRTPHKPLRMLVLADTKGDLDAAYEEGMILKKGFEELKKDVQINLKTSHIKAEYIRRSLREYDIIHYAGHAEYNPKDTSRGGWQTADGVFSTDDINGMRGGAPLPLLIFSNACQSGKTEPWHLASNGEKGVYGLANAFLLSGVQHYIGTFWDIQDRVGLCLAEVFYKNLLDGMSIGGSLKNARSHLIQTYGVENTTWMAYMLYGDPTSHYFGVQEMQDVRKGHDAIASKTSDKLRGVKGQAEGAPTGETIALKPSPYSPFRPLNRAILLLLLLLIPIAVFTILRRANHPPPVPSQPLSQYGNKGDGVSSLIEMIEERLKEKTKDEGHHSLIDAQDDWSSRPVTMAIFGYISKENEARDDPRLRRLNDKVSIEISAAVHNGKKLLELVNRKHLEEILKELQLSTSDLAGRQSDLVRIGRLMGARFILFSELRPSKRQYKINVSVTETETSAIPFYENYIKSLRNEKELEEAAAHIAARVLSTFDNPYAVKGKIIALGDSNRIELNIGSRVGVSPGLMMTALDGSDGSSEVGQIRIITAQKDSSLGEVVITHRPLRKGDKVIARE